MVLNCKVAICFLIFLHLQLYRSQGMHGGILEDIFKNLILLWRLLNIWNGLICSVFGIPGNKCPLGLEHILNH